jgi:hypothetical protein
MWPPAVSQTGAHPASPAWVTPRCGSGNLCNPMDLRSLPQTTSKRTFMLPAHPRGITTQHRKSPQSASQRPAKPASRPPYQPCRRQAGARLSSRLRVAGCPALPVIDPTHDQPLACLCAVSLEENTRSSRREVRRRKAFSQPDVRFEGGRDDQPALAGPQSAGGRVVPDGRPAGGRETRPGERARSPARGAAAEPGHVDDPVVR